MVSIVRLSLLINEMPAVKFDEVIMGHMIY